MLLRIATVCLMILYLVVPVADQIACGEFCGPSPETTVSAKPVSHSEDECLLVDGFERPGRIPGAEEPIHIHFCTLCSTFVALLETSAPEMMQSGDAFPGPLVTFESVFAEVVPRPPVLAL